MNHAEYSEYIKEHQEEFNSFKSLWENMPREVKLEFIRRVYHTSGEWQMLFDRAVDAAMIGGVKSGARMIATERKRQVEEEGWTAEHDAQHSTGAMAMAGGCYATVAAHLLSTPSPSYKDVLCSNSPAWWPWDKKWWKPTPEDPKRQLIKAGALIAAEIDRLIAEGNDG